jgi:[ribosomal protein S18]-alanine N-acetyltransferase
MSVERASHTEHGALDVRVEPMRKRHLRSVLRIEGKLPHVGWSLGLYLSELAARDGRIYLVARAEHAVVGFAGALLVGEEAHVTTISVDPTWQGRRIATRMLLVLVRKALERGAQAMTLEVRASNEAAIRLYRRFGFAPAGIRENYYRDVGEDALIMWVSDTQSTAFNERLDRIDQQLPDPTVVEEVGW